MPRIEAVMCATTPEAEREPDRRTSSVADRPDGVTTPTRYEGWVAALPHLPLDWDGSETAARRARGGHLNLGGRSTDDKGRTNVSGLEVVKEGRHIDRTPREDQSSNSHRTSERATSYPRACE